jgi:hypothetical protein
MAFESRKREEELLARLATLLTDAESKGIAKTQIAQERMLLETACKEYIFSRNYHLERMLRRMETPPGYEDAIRNLAKGLDPIIGRIFGERLKTLGKNSPQAGQFCMQAENEEAAFVTGLKRVIDSAAKLDYLVSYEKKVKKQTEDLEIRWASVTKQHADYDAIEKQIADEMALQINNAAKEAAVQTATKGESMRRLLDAAVQTPIPPGVVLPQWVEVAIESVKIAVNYFNVTRDQLPARLQRFQDAYRSEVGTTLVLFKSFREETKQFIDEYGYQKADNENLAGQAALEDIYKACVTGGQRDDVRIFADEAKKFLQARYNTGKTTWDDFVKKHETKFFGAISPLNAEGLLATSAWRERKAAIKHMDLHSLLSAWRDETRNHKIIEVANRGAELKQLFGYLVDEMVKLQTALEETMKAVRDYERLNEQREQDAKSLA